LRTLHTRPRVQRAPGIPCALYFKRDNITGNSSGAMRREIAAVYLKCSGLLKIKSKARTRAC
jgi:hypothetical protein